MNKNLQNEAWENKPGVLKQVKFKTDTRKCLKKRWGLITRFKKKKKKYLLELNGPKTYNGKNNKTKDEAT